MDILWWHWVVLGLGLAVSELAVASFFIIWFGVAAILVGLLMLAMPEMAFSVQIVLWTLGSAVLTALWFKVFKPSDKTRAGQADEALGETGVLVKATEAYGRGEVRFQKPIMGSDVWPCLSDESIAVGERVKVVGVDGQLLKVKRG